MSLEVSRHSSSARGGPRRGRSNGTSRVFSGWIVRPHFANRLGRTVSNPAGRSLFTGKAHMTKSSAVADQGKEAPFSRGWTSRGEPCVQHVVQETDSRGPG